MAAGTAAGAAVVPSAVCRGDPLWVNDNEVEGCRQCMLNFTLLRRKHHCRKCGQIYCE